MIRERRSTGVKDYTSFRSYIFKFMADNLSVKLTYHGLHHTLEVLSVVNDYIDRFKLSSREANLLKIGAIMHDVGFVNTYENHEEESSRIATELMMEMGYIKEDIKVVQGLILATKVPQKPKNLLERIICDADLDYLGREDFFPISDSLFLELRNFNFLEDKNTWNKIQVRFLEAHTYHTDFAKEHREPRKQIRLEEIRGLIL